MRGNMASLGGVAAVLVLASGGGAGAATIGDGVVAAACGVDSPLHRDVEYDASSTWMESRQDYYAQVLYCPLVVTHGASYSWLRLWAKDAVYYGNYVRAELLAFDSYGDVDGDPSTVNPDPGYCVALSSDAGYLESSGRCQFDADTDAYAYYVRVTIYRTYDSDTRFYAVGVTD